MVTTRNKFTEFFDTHRVFNTDEFQKHCAVTGYHARNTLVKYTQSRHIRKLRNKLLFRKRQKYRKYMIR